MPFCTVKQRVLYRGQNKSSSVLQVTKNSDPIYQNKSEQANISNCIGCAYIT